MRISMMIFSFTCETGHNVHLLIIEEAEHNVKTDSMRSRKSDGVTIWPATPHFALGALEQ